MIALILVILSILAIGIYMMAELRRFKHKLWAISIIVLLLFGYISFNIVLKGRNIDYQSVSGLTQAVKIYFSWLGGIFGNMKSITSNAVKMDWGVNESSAKK